MKHHGAGLLRLVRDEDWVRAFASDWRSVELEEAERAMLDYVEALTASPPRPRREQLHAMRAAGLSDREIFEVNQVAGFFCWVNRTVEGLGVELEDYWPASERHGPSERVESPEAE